MLFMIQILKVMPALLFNGSSMDILTPQGIVPLALEDNQNVTVHVPDFYTFLTFRFRHRQVSYSIVKLVQLQKVSFQPFPLLLALNIERIVEKGDRRTELVGHRGSGGDEFRKQNQLPYIPENSIESFEDAFALGANWVELDVTITQDDVIVLHHDYDIAGKLIWNMTFAEFKSHVKGAVSLMEVFQKLNPQVNLNVEIKYPSKEEVESEKITSVPSLNDFLGRFLEILSTYRENRGVVVSSFEPEALLYLKRHEPDLMIVLLTEGIRNKYADSRKNSIEEAIDFCVENDLQGINVDSEAVSSNPVEYTETVHSAGLSLVLYFYRSFLNGKNFTEEVLKFDCAGADAVVIDDIRKTKEILGGLTTCSYNDISKGEALA